MNVVNSGSVASRRPMLIDLESLENTTNDNLTSEDADRPRDRPRTGEDVIRSHRHVIAARRRDISHRHNNRFRATRDA